MAVEVVSWRITAMGPAVERHGSLALAATAGAPKGRRRALFAEGARQVAVYDRSALARDQQIEGPAIIEERETTLVVLPGWQARVDGLGSVVAQRVQ